jgi:hypothetical protein
MPLCSSELTPQVQDKALDVLSWQLRGHRDALREHLPLIVGAASHSATSVRKRAVDILWDCYVNNDVYCSDESGRLEVVKLLVRCIHLLNGA